MAKDYLSVRFRLQDEVVLAVEQPSYHELSLPPELMVWLNGEHLSVETHASGTWRLNVYAERLANDGPSFNRSDKRIPARIVWEVHEERPHSLSRSFNLDLRFDAVHCEG